jgi:hypothetical protein
MLTDMDRRRQPRIAATLPVRIWGIDANCLPFMQLATARNISENGALLEGMRCNLQPGEVVDVQYNNVKAEFLVVWAGRPGTPKEGEIGLQSLPAQPCIWDVCVDRMCACVGQG